MEAKKLKLEIIKTMLNYALIALFGSVSYAFINFESLSAVRFFIVSLAALSSFVAVVFFVILYFRLLRGLDV